MKVQVVFMLSVLSFAQADVLCTDCEKLVASLIEFLTNTEVQEIVQTQLDGQVCARLGEDLKQTCEEYIQAFVPSIFQYIDQKVSPEDVCTTATICPGTPTTDDSVLQTIAFFIQAAHYSVQAKGYNLETSSTCEYCELIVDEVHQVVANPEIQANLKSGLLQLCGLLPIDKDECSTLVGQYADQMFTILEEYLIASVLCPQLGFCPTPPAFQELVA